MVCSHCGGCGHNKRTCTAPKVTSNQPTRSEKRVAKSLAALLPHPNNKKVSKPLEGLGGCQNIWKEPKTFYVAKKVSKPLEDISSCQNIWKEPKDYYTAQKCRENTCATCGGKGHNSRTCLLAPPTVITSSTPEKKHKKCGICGELGHNSRTCNLKCQPCSDQVPRSYCFAGMTAAQAVKMTEILECGSIYGETEEYPHLAESPSDERKAESITSANGEIINLGLA